MHYFNAFPLTQRLWRLWKTPSQHDLEYLTHVMCTLPLTYKNHCPTYWLGKLWWELDFWTPNALKKTAFYKVLLNSAGSAVSFRYVVRALFNLFIKHSKKFYLRSCHLHPDLAERDWFCSIATAVTRSDWRGSLGQRSLFILILWQYRVLLMLCIWDIRLFDGWNAITWVFSLVVLWTAFQGVLGNIWSVSIFFSMGTGTDLWACS